MLKPSPSSARLCLLAGHAAAADRQRCTRGRRRRSCSLRAGVCRCRASHCMPLPPQRCAQGCHHSCSRAPQRVLLPP
uniref:Uncharacterized protein n=1 Tax=Setaria viridis TaxID=4556 RepID=A0A4U6TSE5_SETVI|nr:hypothetical protein SEVIR_7G196250v2 [Setaria viridis]